MIRIKKGFNIIGGAALLFGAMTFSTVNASNPISLFVDGKEIRTEIQAELRNGTVFAPVRPIAEALGTEVQWDGKKNTVTISTKSPVSEKQVKDWITSQGMHKDYYWDGLSYHLIDLDADQDLEVVAMIDGAVHLGNFFIFDKTVDGQYKLVEEKGWKIKDLKLKQAFTIGEKKVFETIERTGGTGLDVFIAHLWYMDQGKRVEAWTGTLKERGTFQDKYALTVGSYQYLAESNQLFSWETSYTGDIESDSIKDVPLTFVKSYTFDGTRFIED